MACCSGIRCTTETITDGMEPTNSSLSDTEKLALFINRQSIRQIAHEVQCSREHRLNLTHSKYTNLLSVNWVTNCVHWY